MIFDGVRVESCTKKSSHAEVRFLLWVFGLVRAERSRCIDLGILANEQRASIAEPEAPTYWMVERKCRVPQSMLACVHAIPQEKGKARSSILDSRRSRFRPHKQI